MSDVATFEELPPRFQKVAERVGKGWTYPEIAHDLDLTVKTVEHYAAELATRLEGEHLDGLRPKDRIMTWWLVDGPGAAS